MSCENPTAVFEDVVEKLLPVAIELVSNLRDLAGREVSRGTPFGEVSAATLDKMSGKFLTKFRMRLTVGKCRELRFEERQEICKAELIAGMRRSRCKDNVPRRIFRDALDELPSALASPASHLRTGVRLIYDHEFRCGLPEHGGVGVRLDVVKRNNGERVVLEDRKRLVRDVPLKTVGGG